MRNPPGDSGVVLVGELRHAGADRQVAPDPNAAAHVEQRVAAATVARIEIALFGTEQRITEGNVVREIGRRCLEPAVDGDEPACVRLLGHRRAGGSGDRILRLDLTLNS